MTTNIRRSPAEVLIAHSCSIKESATSIRRAAWDSRHFSNRMRLSVAKRRRPIPILLASALKSGSNVTRIALFASATAATSASGESSPMAEIASHHRPRRPCCNMAMRSLERGVTHPKVRAVTSPVIDTAKPPNRRLPLTSVRRDNRACCSEERAPPIRAGLSISRCARRRGATARPRSRRGRRIIAAALAACPRLGPSIGTVSGRAVLPAWSGRSPRAGSRYGRA
jgi:hypothetical protein